MITLSVRIKEQPCENVRMPDATELKQGVLRVIRHPLSLKLLLAIAIVLTAQFAWLLSHAEKLDTPSLLPALFLCELPLLVCLYFLIAGDRRKREIRGAGTTFGVALGFCALSPLLFFVLVMTIWDTGDRYLNLVALQHFLPVCFVVALALLAMAWMQGSGNRAPFVKAAFLGVVCFVVVLFLTFVSGAAGSGDAKQRAAFQTPSTSPSSHVTAIAACLIRHQFLHPQEGVPASLQEIHSDWNCDASLADPAGLHGYWIFYSRGNGNSLPGGKDFRIEAVPTEKGRQVGDVAGIDGRGEALDFRGLGATPAQRGPHFSIQTVDAGGGALHILRTVRGNVRGYMETHDPLTAPPSLDGVVPAGLLKNGCDRYDDSEVKPKERVLHEPTDRLCYSIEYFHPPEKPADSFALSVQCMSYGENCLRSYFLDYDDMTHATAEPRAATAQDPGLEPCETVQVCHDTIWTPSQQGSEWIFIKASFLNAVHSTSW